MGGASQQSWTPTRRRGPIAAEYRSPGPACVALPPLLGKTVPDSKRGSAPAFSFGGRHTAKNDSPGPGPARYNVSGLGAKGKTGTPASSLHGRTNSTNHEITPAPGSYDPEKAGKIILASSPKYSFGIKTEIEKTSCTPAPDTYKHENVNLDKGPQYSLTGKCIEKKTDDVPAPNVYNIPSILGKTKEGNKKAAPAYSISSRQKTFSDDRLSVPGPGTYEIVKSDTVKLKSPAYTISSRYQLLDGQSLTPGPGAHCPEKVMLNISPAHSFGIRHSPYICNITDAA